jgi:sulfate permease, SulP family
VANFLPITLQFRPRLLESLPSYDRAKFKHDLAAGVTVGVVALPLAMAFAIASGLKPEAGIFTAIVAGFLISALGGSRVQIGGPAGAFIVIVYGIVERYGVASLLLATMFAGVLLFVMGLLRLGNLVRFVPVAIVIGFTNGIAVLIALSQVKEFFGLRIATMPADFFAKLKAIFAALPTVDFATLLLAAASLLIIIYWPKPWEQPHHPALRAAKHVPGTVVALVLGVLAVVLLKLEVETIGTRFGGIPRALPSLSMPDFDWQRVRQLFAPTITIALLGAIESLLCARVADGMIEDRHDANQELMAQGIANFAAPLFGGFCATGTIARTVTNIRAGAFSPVAGMIHALTLLVIILVAAPFAQHIPLACLAAILMYVAYSMGEWREFARLRRFSNNYRIILLATFLLTVAIDLTVAVEVSLVLACLFFIVRVSALTRIEPITETEVIAAGVDHKNVEAYRLSGSLFFGAVDKMEHLLDPKRRLPRVSILDMTMLINLDTTGLESLAALHKMCVKRGAVLILCGLQAQPLSLLQRSGFLETLGAANVVASLHHSWERAKLLKP